MNIPARILDVKCIECGKHFEASTHKRMGLIKVVCTHCNAAQEYMVKPPKVGAPSDEPVDKFHTQMPVRVLGKVTLQGDKYVIENRAKIGKATSFICPKCNKPIAIKPEQPGVQVITCKDCNAKVHITAYDAEAEERLQKEQERLRQEQERIRQQQEEQRRQQEQERLRKEQEEQERLRQEQERLRKEQEEVEQPHQYNYIDIPDPEPEPEPTPSDETVVTPRKRRVTNGELQWGGGFMSSPNKIRLLDGSTLIGRKDPNTPSDIQFIDPEMSRRSVQIDAEPRNGVMTFTLTVLKDLNPVLVNGRRVPQGMSVLLKSGVKIKMGQTTLTFKLV
ncbi:MAG: FHA domain-containing protein [Prevotella sp.]|nr:FHA domain-containing protein [Prevotella sp.]MBR1449907.1 FHA domain-containing protein [Prevotella sp.]